MISLLTSYKTKIIIIISAIFVSVIGFYGLKIYFRINSLENKIEKQETIINNLDTKIKSLEAESKNKDFENKWLERYSEEEYKGEEYEIIKYPDINGSVIKFK